jgi:inosose dehydratase
MERTIHRRDFSKALALGVGAMWTGALHAAPAARKIKIGYTCITWGTFPRDAEAIATFEPAVADIAALGFHSVETFAQVVEDWDTRGALGALLERHKLPLQSAYMPMNLTEPDKRKEGLERLIRWAKIVRKHGGTFGVLAPNGVKRDAWDFKEHRANIVSALNDAAKALADEGLESGPHPHTGTCLETSEEVAAVMESVDSKYVKFAPDVGQLQKAGADAAKLVRDFLPIVRHLHLKDWDGGPHFGGYCPLGQGKVDIAGILEMVEGLEKPPTAMVELDPSKDAPITPLVAAKATKGYLQKLGYEFRA